MAIGNPSDRANRLSTIYSVLAIVSITLLSLFLGEQPIPFYSAAFVFSASAVFFLAVTYGTVLALAQAAGALTLLILLNISAEASTVVLSIQLPLLILFYSLLAILPNIAPYVLKDEICTLEADIGKIKKKVEELSETCKNEHKETQVKKSRGSRELATKISSRNTLLVTYARGLLQCGSVREIINLLFYNISKAFSPKQCVMLIKSQGKDEFVISRIIHKDHQRLENQRITEVSPPLTAVLKNRKCMKLPVKTSIYGDIESEFIIPIELDKEIHAIFSIADLKDGTISEDDTEFIKVLGNLTSEAAEQITVVTARQS